LIILFLLTGLVIPGALIASATDEFSFIESYTTPFPFIYNTLVQAAGIFLFWPTCIWFFSTKKIKGFITVLFSLTCIIAVLNTFIFSGNYGFLTNTLKFFDPGRSLFNPQSSLYNIIAIILTSMLFLIIFFTKIKKMFFSFQIVLIITLAVFSIINIVKIKNEYSIIAGQQMTDNNFSKVLTPEYSFSKNGKNVLVIILDRAISGYIPYIFDEKPALASRFDGFTWYPNCVSFGDSTMMGMPPVFGGYEYTPEKINKRSEVLLTQKINEALLLQPYNFSTAGYSSTITDIPYDSPVNNPDLHPLFNNYPAIHLEKFIGKYTTDWLRIHPDIKIISVTDLLRNTLVRFSFFKISPVVFRNFIYDNGDYLGISDIDRFIDKKKHINNELTMKGIDNYAALDFLTKVTTVEEKTEGTFTIIYNELTHEPAFLQPPDYVPANMVDNTGNGPFANETHYHVDMAALLLLGKWFDFLKETQVYDNTRIVIVSDHGIDISSKFPGNIILPGGQSVQAFNPLLLFKDFNSHGALITDNKFMTNADTPFLAFNGIINNPVNPFADIPFREEKINGVILPKGSPGWNLEHHTKYQFKIKADDWLCVHDNIFNPENWEPVSNLP
jgi:hypothetical protein